MRAAACWPCWKPATTSWCWKTTATTTATTGSRSMAQARSFTIHAVGYEEGLTDLRSVREAVFVQEQGVPPALEWDELDPVCHHVVARDGAGDAIGTGRLTPARGIGRMAVLPEWRGRGVGDALLQALLEQARTLEWPEVSLHAQATAIGFYARAG